MGAGPRPDPYNHHLTPAQEFERARRRHQRDRATLDSLDRRGATPTASRRSTKGSPGVITGYPVRYGVETVIAGLFREIIAPRALSERLKKDDVIAVRDHNGSLLLGRSGAGTLKLSEDDLGVYMRVTLPATSGGQEAWELTKRGDISQGSFMFSPGVERWYPATKRGELPLVVQEKVSRLYDVTICAHGAYPQTAVGIDATQSDDRERALEGRIKLNELRLKRGPGALLPPPEVRAFLLNEGVQRRYSFGIEAA